MKFSKTITRLLNAAYVIVVLLCVLFCEYTTDLLGIKKGVFVTHTLSLGSIGQHDTI